MENNKQARQPADAAYLYWKDTERNNTRFAATEAELQSLIYSAFQGFPEYGEWHTLSFRVDRKDELEIARSPRPDLSQCPLEGPRYVKLPFCLNCEADQAEFLQRIWQYLQKTDIYKSIKDQKVFCDCGKPGEISTRMEIILCQLPLYDRLERMKMYRPYNDDWKVTRSPASEAELQSLVYEIFQNFCVARVQDCFNLHFSFVKSDSRWDENQKLEIDWTPDYTYGPLPYNYVLPVFIKLPYKCVRPSDQTNFLKNLWRSLREKISLTSGDVYESLKGYTVKMRIDESEKASRMVLYCCD